jgi:hypothetical protein
MFEARAEAIRLVTRKLIARSQESDEARAELRRRPGDIARQLGSSSAQETQELLAIVGLEVLKTDREFAEEIARDLTQQFEQQPAKPVEPNQVLPPRPTAPPSLVALLVALNQDARANALYPQGPSQGWAVGMAYQGKWDRALQFAAIPEPNQRFQALTAVAEVALATVPEKVKEILSAAFDNEKDHSPNIFWSLRQLAGIGARAGLNNVVQQFLDKLPAAGLRSEAQLALYRGQSEDAPVDLNALNSEAAKKTQAYPRLISFLSRRAAYQGANVQKAADSWDLDALRPLGYIGAALGMQDAAVGSQQVVQKK